MSRERATKLAREVRRYAAVFGILLLMCLSYEARGDNHENAAPDVTAEEDLAPGIKLRIESCGYNKPRAGSIGIDDDDSAADDDDVSPDDDDVTPDDDDVTPDDDDVTPDDDDVTPDDDDSALPDDDDDSAADDDDSAG